MYKSILKDNYYKNKYTNPRQRKNKTRHLIIRAIKAYIWFPGNLRPDNITRFLRNFQNIERNEASLIGGGGRNNVP